MKQAVEQSVVPITPPPVSPEQIAAEKLEKERADNEKKRRDLIESILKKCDFKEVDDLRYSLVFNNGLFTFRIPTLMERTKIKSIMAQIAFVPNSGIFSAAMEIEGSGDLDLICSTKLITHTAILMDQSPKDFDLSKLSEGEEFTLGHYILVCEGEFLERKKKA